MWSARRGCPCLLRKFHRVHHQLSVTGRMMATTSEAPPGNHQAYSSTYISVCLAINVALSISIILLNKAVYSHVHFPNMTLTCVHFVFTTVGMVCCRCLGLFSFKSLPLRHMVPVSLTFCGFVVLTNLSLQSNTVGTYQIIKSMTTPMIIVIQSTFYARIFSLPVKLTLVYYFHLAVNDISNSISSSVIAFG